MSHLADYRSDRGVFLSCVRRRKRIEARGWGDWSGTRKLEGEALHGALTSRRDLGLTNRDPDWIIP
jgi:hypothetical protein